MSITRSARLGKSRKAARALGGEGQGPINFLVLGHAGRMFRFGVVGASGVFVNMGLLYVLAGVFGLNHLVAAVFATEAAILSNFVFNDRWTFRASRPGRRWPVRALRYNAVALGGLVISIGILAALTYLFSMHYMVANLFAIGAGTLWNYTGSSLFTWAKAKETVSEDEFGAKEAA